MEHPVRAVERAQLRIPKASELVADHLRRQIIDDHIVEGQPLPPEADLMQAFNVSRPTLREAYRILETEGLLSVRRGARGGARAHKPTADGAGRYAAVVLQAQKTSLHDVFDARALLEGPAARMFANNASPGGLEVLRGINDEAAMHSDDLVTQLAHHHRFHDTLLQLTGNKTLVLLAGMVDNILQSVNFALIENRATASASAEEAGRRAQQAHLDIVALFESGDVDEADTVWRAHLADTAATVLGHIDRHETLDAGSYAAR